MHERLAEHAALIERLYDGQAQYSYPRINNVYINTPLNTGSAVLYANKDGTVNEIKDTYKVTGIITEENIQRVGVFSVNLLSSQQDETIQIFNKNLIHWLIDSKYEPKNIVLSHLSDNYYSSNKAWLEEIFPDVVINDHQSCDFENLSECIDTQQPDLIIYSDLVHSDKNYSNVEASIQKAERLRIPFLAVANGALMGGHGEIMFQPIYDWIGLVYGEQGYVNERPHAENASVSKLKESPDINEIIAFLQRFIDASFTEDALSHCTKNMVICSEEKFDQEFGYAARQIQGLLKKNEIKKIDLFKTANPDYFLNAIQLLADKYRNGIDYPITGGNAGFCESLIC